MASDADLRFTKVEGLGNDFLLVDVGADSAAWVDRIRAAAPALCNRRTGVGGDGVLVVGPPRSEGAAASMTVVNFDGSRPEMCGNGLRCVAEWVGSREGSDRLVIDTDAGALHCAVLHRPSEGMARVRVDMGPGRRLGSLEPEAAGRRMVGISMGNPHAIAFVDPDEDPEALARSLGPQIEVDPAYPERTNVEFAKVGEEIELWVWERGCGITGACGTGACATAVAAVDEGLAKAGRELKVRLPGGTLRIVVPREPSAGVEMTGPARRVFTGQVRLP